MAFYKEEADSIIPADLMNDLYLRLKGDHLNVNSISIIEPESTEAVIFLASHRKLYKIFGVNNGQLQKQEVELKCLNENSTLVSVYAVYDSFTGDIDYVLGVKEKIIPDPEKPTKIKVKKLTYKSYLHIHAENKGCVVVPVDCLPSKIGHTYLTSQDGEQRVWVMSGEKMQIVGKLAVKEQDQQLTEDEDFESDETVSKVEEKSPNADNKFNYAEESKEFEASTEKGNEPSNKDGKEDKTVIKEDGQVICKECETTTSEDSKATSKEGNTTTSEDGKTTFKEGESSTSEDSKTTTIEGESTTGEDGKTTSKEDVEEVGSESIIKDANQVEKTSSDTKTTFKEEVKVIEITFGKETKEGIATTSTEEIKAISDKDNKDTHTSKGDNLTNTEVTEKKTTKITIKEEAEDYNVSKKEEKLISATPDLRSKFSVSTPLKMYKPLKSSLKKSRGSIGSDSIATLTNKSDRSSGESSIDISKIDFSSWHLTGEAEAELPDKIKNSFTYGGVRFRRKVPRVKVEKKPEVKEVEPEVEDEAGSLFQYISTDFLFPEFHVDYQIVKYDMRTSNDRKKRTTAIGGLMGQIKVCEVAVVGDKDYFIPLNYKKNNLMTKECLKSDPRIAGLKYETTKYGLPSSLEPFQNISCSLFWPGRVLREYFICYESLVTEIRLFHIDEAPAANYPLVLPPLPNTVRKLPPPPADPKIYHLFASNLDCGKARGIIFRNVLTKNVMNQTLKNAAMFGSITCSLVFNFTGDRRQFIALGGYRQGVMLFYKHPLKPKTDPSQYEWRFMYNLTFDAPIVSLHHADIVGDGIKRLIVLTAAGVQTFIPPTRDINDALTARLCKLVTNLGLFDAEKMRLEMKREKEEADLKEEEEADLEDDVVELSCDSE